MLEARARPQLACTPVAHHATTRVGGGVAVEQRVLDDHRRGALARRAATADGDVMRHVTGVGDRQDAGGGHATTHPAGVVRRHSRGDEDDAGRGVTSDATSGAISTVEHQGCIGGDESSSGGRHTSAVSTSGVGRDLYTGQLQP